MTAIKPTRPFSVNELSPHSNRFLGLYLIGEAGPAVENLAGPHDDLTIDDLNGGKFLRFSNKYLQDIGTLVLIQDNVIITTWKPGEKNIYTNGALSVKTGDLYSNGDWLFSTTSTHLIAIYNIQFQQNDIDFLSMYPYIAVDKIIQVSFPGTSQITRFTNKSCIPAIETQWKLSSKETSFTVITKSKGKCSTKSGNIIDSDLNRLDMWLPPFQTYNVQMRQKRQNETFTPWTPIHKFPTRRHETSFDRFQILSRAGKTIS